MDKLQEVKRLNNPSADEVEVWKAPLPEEITKGSYLVSSFGRVKNSKGVILKVTATNSKDGYARYNLSITRADGSRGQKKFAGHVLVANLFVEGKTEEMSIVNHDDGDKRNNYHGNLEWTDHSGNLSHAHRTGLRQQEGTSNPSNVHNEELVHFICKNRKIETPSLVGKIIKEFGYTNEDYHRLKVLSNHVKAKRRWTSISENYF